MATKKKAAKLTLIEKRKQKQAKRAARDQAERRQGELATRAS